MSLELLDNGALLWKNKKGKCHREKGPAFISTDNGISYHFNGLLHRLDGPAVIYPDGFKRYFIHGKEYTKEEYYTKVKEL